VKNINSFVKILTLGIVVMIAPSAMATLTKSETKTFSGNTTLTFQQFNPGWGTLESIEIIFDLGINGGWLIVDNDGTSQVSVTMELGATAAISSTDVDLSSLIFNALTASTTTTRLLDPNVGDGPGNVDDDPPDGYFYNGCADSNSDSGFISALDFAGYTGIGTFGIDVAITNIADWGSLLDVEGLPGAVAILPSGSSVTVKYTYVPEPATMALLGLGSMVFLRGRKP